jgi:hypothetical protein
MIKIKKILDKITVKNILFCVLISSVILIVWSSCIYGVKATATMAQSFGIGLGSLFAGLAGLTAFLDWFDKAKRAEKYIKELKEKYPRKLLNDGKLKIVRKTDSNMVYLLDERNNNFIKRWFQDQEARKDLGFSSSDTEEKTMSNEDLKKYIEEDPIVAKKNFY